MSVDGKGILRKSKRSALAEPILRTGEDEQKAVLRPHKYATYRKCFILIRHAETCADVWPEWVDLCFDSQGKYTQVNLNFPRFLIKRPDVHEYIHDPPITQMGWTQASCVTESLAISSMPVTCIYSSPSFKCVQTAQAIASRFEKKHGVKATIRVEPALAEFIGFNENPVARFFDVQTLKDCQYHIADNYTPITELDDIQFIKTEKKEAFYHRIAKAFEHIRAKTKNEVRVLLVVPPSVMDALVKGAKNKTPDMVSDHQLKYRMKDFYPPLSNIFLVQNMTEIKNKTFSILLRPIPKMTIFGYVNRVDLEFLKASTDFESKDNEEQKSEEESMQRRKILKKVKNRTSVVEVATAGDLKWEQPSQIAPKVFDDKYREEGTVFQKKKIPFEEKKLGKGTRPNHYMVDEKEKSKESIDEAPGNENIAPLEADADDHEEDEPSKKHNYANQVPKTGRRHRK
ncbi:unnamed protein product [Bursaphelenchus xylophilus]|uniref:(pine wood nematode) hypothetical protein n=1 Tax=Bursaphelenchus xylophilus TaxID=6326 RepID=A0A1I7RKN6_BURXY|nr:unnamed protein product [Bursaphelenchus xylophilus]CAG9131199.1 unnamed protein product [Bursaphelenchus xylophilus]